MGKPYFIVPLVMGAASFVWANAAWAGPITHRQVNQHKRIHQGVVSGELTGTEAALLGREQCRIRDRKRVFWSDGELTPGERARIHQLQDRAGANIYKKKHNPIIR